MPSARRRQDLSVIMLWIVVVLLFVAAVVPWIHYVGHSIGRQVFSNDATEPTGLTWQANQPPELVVMGLAATALVLALIASSRPEIRVWVVLSTIIFGAVFGRLLAAQAPIGLPWHLAPLPAQRPSAGYWLAVISGILTVVSIALALSSAGVRVERPNPTASAVADDERARLPAPDLEDPAWPGSG